MTYLLPTEVNETHVAKVQSAFDRSEIHSAVDWIIRCATDKAQLWRAGEFWGITEVVQTKSGRALHIVAAAGEYVPELFEQMEAWGRSVGCKKVYFTGRKGWLKRMPGYELTAITMEKGL